MAAIADLQRLYLISKNTSSLNLTDDVHKILVYTLKEYTGEEYKRVSRSEIAEEFNLTLDEVETMIQFLIKKAVLLRDSAMLNEYLREEFFKLTKLSTEELNNLVSEYISKEMVVNE